MIECDDNITLWFCEAVLGGFIMKKIIIPEPLQITMDDLGWFCGSDGRKKMEPARTSITRRHFAEDYEIVNEIGKRLGMKINCAMIMGEWDPDNRLKNIPALSPYGTNWNNALYFNAKEAKRCVDVINSSEYIDIAIHGLQHTYYIEGNQYSNSDYYFRNGNEWLPAPDSEIRTRLDAWYDLVEYHGIKKNVNSFIPPNFTYKFNHISKILKDYGVLYISTIFPKTIDSNVQIEDGIITVNRNNNLIPYNEMESNLDKYDIVSGVFGCHWANVCYSNPKENYKLADTWVEYFANCKKKFGIILSQSISFCATQTVYKSYSKLELNNEKCTIDLSDVPDADGLENAFYISSDELLTQWTGCDIELYEKCGDFINYKVTPKDKLLTIV